MHSISQTLSFSNKLFWNSQFLVANDFSESREISIETGRRLCVKLSYYHNDILPPPQSAEVFGAYVLISWKYLLGCPSCLCSSVLVLKSNRNIPKTV